MKKILIPFFLIIVFSVASFLFFKNNPIEKSYQAADTQSTQKEGPAPEINKTYPDSIPIMSEKEFTGSDLKLEKVLATNESYTRYHITYKSEGFKISGIMNVPQGNGPFPILILNHGYIDPKNYTNGQGLKREQDYFARNGYVVLHSDYRNHAQSDFDQNNEVRPRSGYVEDVLNAISALKNSELTFLDKENIGMLGHSMGGGITLNVMVTKPEIAKAYALLAPINSDYKENFDRWVVNDWPEEIAQQFYQIYGTYKENPEAWKSLSAKYYFDKVASPVMLHQGALDEDVPVEWSRELNDLLKQENKNIAYFEYPNEGHTFINAQPVVMERTLKFFDENLKQDQQ
ncbi:MAG: peptidase S9 prolyl oligopeptidase active site protein [uncultured bacterium]|nr:MAG: peptidase S9 prolyl oligopeptidase active site protein [uncultured bacterium]